MCQYSSRERHAERLALRAPGQPRGRRRGAGVRRGERGDARGPHHAVGRGHLVRRRTPRRGSRSRELHPRARRGARRSRSRTRAARPRATSRGWAASRSRPRKAAGRRSGPSAIAFGDYPAPRAMTRGGDRAPRSTHFRAPRALRARGRLRRGRDPRRRTATCCTSFCSPLSNRRTDDYGGSLENRMRFPLAVARAVRDALARATSRCSCASRPPTGRKAAGTSSSRSRSASALKALGVDLVDCSSGGNVARPEDRRSARATRCRSPQAVRREARHSHRRGRAHHRARAGRADRAHRPGRRRRASRARCCATRTGRATPRRRSASRCRGRTSTSAATSGPSDDVIRGKIDRPLKEGHRAQDHVVPADAFPVAARRGAVSESPGHAARGLPAGWPGGLGIAAARRRHEGEIPERPGRGEQGRCRGLGGGRRGRARHSRRLYDRAHPALGAGHHAAAPGSRVQDARRLRAHRQRGRVLPDDRGAEPSRRTRTSRR